MKYLKAATASIHHHARIINMARSKAAMDYLKIKSWRRVKADVVGNMLWRIAARGRATRDAARVTVTHARCAAWRRHHGGVSESNKRIAHGMAASRCSAAWRWRIYHLHQHICCALQQPAAARHRIDMYAARIAIIAWHSMLLAAC